MRHFLVTALDTTDGTAPARRAAGREVHLAGIQELIAAGNFMFGGALLDGDDEVVGSVLIMRFEDKEAFDAWLQTDIYTVSGVWGSVDVRPCRPAAIPNPPWEQAAAR